MPLAKIQTPLIDDNEAIVESELFTGLAYHFSIHVLDSDGASSANTCNVTITDNVLGRTLLEVTGISGIDNQYPVRIEEKDTTGAALGTNTPIYLANQRLTVAVANGTDTDFVRVFVQLIS